jgi:hypothetical protein
LKLVSDSQGRIVAVWPEYDGLPQFRIKTVTWRDGEVGPVETLASSDSYIALRSLSRDAAGDAWLTWFTERDGAVHATRSAATGTWAVPQRFADEAELVHAASNDTSALVAWYDRGTVRSLYTTGATSQQFASNLIESSTFPGNNRTGGLAANQSRYLAAWNILRTDLEEHALIASFDGTGWSTPAFLDAEGTTVHRAEPDVTTHADNFALTWTQWDTADATGERDVWVQVGGF